MTMREALEAFPHEVRLWRGNGNVPEFLQEYGQDPARFNGRLVSIYPICEGESYLHVEIEQGVVVEIKGEPLPRHRSAAGNIRIGMPLIELLRRRPVKLEVWGQSQGDFRDVLLRNPGIAAGFTGSLKHYQGGNLLNLNVWGYRFELEFENGRVTHTERVEIPD
jgi:hypothetical protein